MADDFFQQPGPVPVPSGAGVDEFQRVTEGQTDAPIHPGFGNLGQGPPATPGSPPAAGPEGGAQAPPSPSPSALGLFTEGVQRNIGQFHAAPTWAMAANAALSGDFDTAVRHAADAEAIENSYPQSRWSLDKIRGLDDFGSWAAERLGENSITLLGSMALGTGGYAAGAAVANRLVAQGLIQSGSRAAWMLRAGAAGAAATPLNVLLEGAGTAQEQYQVTGRFTDVEAKRALAGGAIKGALESITPFVVGRALALPGFQLGRSYVGGIGRIAGLEGVTEMSQEAVDIWMRQLADPNYSYFDSNASWYMGPGAWRIAESGAAGALVGGVYGAAGHHIERRQEQRRAGEPQQEYVPTEAELNDARSRLGGPAANAAQTPPLEVIAPDKVTITTSSPGMQQHVIGPQHEWVAKSDFGEVFAFVDPETKTLRVESSSLTNQKNKGGGHGLALYKALFDKALAEGYTIHSDSMVSDAAARMYEAMQRRGYQVIGPHGDLKLDKSKRDQYYFNPDGKAIFQIRSGPVTALRNQVIGAQTGGDRLVHEVSAKDPRDDALGASFLGYNTLDSSLDAQARHEAFLDLLEANTKRYVEMNPDGSPGSTLRNSTDVELHDALYRSQNQKPQWVEVDQGSLQASGITAQFQDLPDPSSNRIWFMQNVKPEERTALLLKYAELHKQVVGYQQTLLSKGAPDQQQMEAAYLPYNVLLSAGLRVIPSRGSSFHYTTGKLTGKPVDVAETKRSVQIAYMDFDTGTFDRLVGEQIGFNPDMLSGPEEQTGKKYNGVPVAINLEMFKLGELSEVPDFASTGIVMNPVESFKFTKAMPEAKKKDLITKARALAADVSFVDKYRALMKEGLYLPVTDKSRSIVSMEPIQAETLVPGHAASSMTNVARADEYLSMMRLPKWKWWGPATEPTSVYLDENKIKVENLPLAKQIWKELALMSPSIDKLLKSMHIDKRLDLHVTDEQPNAGLAVATAYLQGGVIAIHPEGIKVQLTASPLDIQALAQETMFHEVGHFVTFELINKLPPGMQDRLLYAWRKSLLAHQTTPSIGFSRTHPISSVGAGYTNVDYYKSFTEWLAEQFRRWATTGWPARNQDQGIYEGFAKKLEQFYKEWKAAYGPMAAENMVKPDFHFSAVMDYWRNYGVVSEQLNQFLRQHTMVQIGEDLLENPSAQEALIAVRGALESMLPMFSGSPSLQISIKDTLSKGIHTSTALGADGRYVSRPTGSNKLTTQGLIELALGALPSNNTEAAARANLAHELMHWYEDFGIIQPNEVKILDAEIRRNRSLHLPSVYLAGLRNKVIAQIDRDIAAGRVRKEDRESQIEYMYQRVKGMEERAYYLMDFANTGIAYSNESRTIMQRILELLQRIMNALNSLGFKSREDVIRSFFNGEMLNREQRAADEARDFAAARQFEYDAIKQTQKFDKAPDFMKEVEPGLWMVMQNYGKRRLYLFLQGQEAERPVAAAIKIKGQIFKGTIHNHAVEAARKIYGQAIINKEIEADMATGSGNFSGFITNHGRYVSRAEAARMVPEANRKEMHAADLPELNPKRTLTTLGTIIGQAELTDRGSKGWEIDKLVSEKVDSLIPLTIRMARHVSQHLGISTQELAKPPGAATYEGMVVYKKFAKGTKWEGVFDYYVKDPKGDNWYSPNYVRKMANYWSLVNAGWKADGNARGFDPAYITESYEMFRKLLTRVPKRAWSDPRLPEMFVEKNAKQWDELQGALVRDGVEASQNQLQQNLGEQPDGPTSTQIERAIEEKARISQAQQAKRLGIPFEMASPETGISLEVGKILDAVGNVALPSRRLGYRTSGQAKGTLSPSRHLKDEMDRIGFFSKRFLNLPQLAKINEHISGLVRYVQHNNEMYQLAQTWIRAADEVARVWEGRPNANKEQIGKLLFWMAEMNYRSANEKAGKVIRQPTNAELGAQITALKLDLDDVSVVMQVKNLFARFLDQVEAIRTAHIQNTFKNNPAGMGLQLQELAKEMSELRAKPYFPMMRFGKFNITVRDPQQNQKVIWASTYETVGQRDAALAEVSLNHPYMRITFGTVPESMIEFMGLPGPLIRMIKEKLPAETGIQWTADQEHWFEQFEMMHAPDKNFRKRWMPSEHVPGYSMDAFRAFAHYFQNGARYISRLQYLDALKSDIDAVRATVRSGQIQNSGRRQAIADYMNSHFKYIMEGGKDYGKTKAFLSLYFLGFSPAAAAVNLTQIPTVMLPTLQHHFGTAQMAQTFNGTLSSLKAAKGGTPKGDQFYLRARDEMINQGRIDVGQAPELGAFAEGANLEKLKAGSRAQRAYRKISYIGMKMFSFIEQFNRELTFKVSWDLAMKNDKLHADPKHRLYEINHAYQLEINNLMGRLGMTEKEATSFIFAREMIDTTQFMYAPYAKPPFMQKAVPNLLLLFFQYTQGMLTALRYNGAAFQMLLVMAFLYGLQGLPGSDDTNELLRALARKIFGKDFDIHGQAREYVRTFTRGTIFDQVGPDLVLHGISRYGFGASLLPEGWAIPRFDASANGSMGRIVPGMAELMHGVAVSSRSRDIVAETSQRVSGAGGSMIFSLLHYMMESPGTIESHRWESLLPRAARAVTKAYRYLPEGSVPDIPLGIGTLKAQGGERSATTGGYIPNGRFDVTDPDDLMTVVGQALGFSATKVNESWEAQRASRDTIQIYNAQKQMIYAQAYRAVRDQSQDAFNDVLKAIRDFNEGVLQVDPSMAIQTRGLLSSIRNRQRAQILQEQFGTTQRGQIPVVSRVLDQYPGVRVQRIQ